MVDLTSTRLDGSGDAGVQHGESLLAYADAVLTGDSEGVDSGRDALTALVGVSGVIDAAAVIAMFQLNTRAADAAGVPLEVGDGTLQKKMSEIGKVIGVSQIR